jgi:hypothetical protein
MFRSHRKSNPRPLNHTFRKDKKYNFVIKSKVKNIKKPVVVIDDVDAETHIYEPRITKIKKENCEFYGGVWWWNNTAILQYTGLPHNNNTKYNNLVQFRKQTSQSPVIKNPKTVIHSNDIKRTIEGFERFKKNQWLKLFIGLNGNKLHHLGDDIIQNILAFAGTIENHNDYRLLKYGFHKRN